MSIAPVSAPTSDTPEQAKPANANATATAPASNASTANPPSHPSDAAAKSLQNSPVPTASAASTLSEGKATAGAVPAQPAQGQAAAAAAATRISAPSAEPPSITTPATEATPPRNSVQGSPTGASVQQSSDTVPAGVPASLAASLPLASAPAPAPAPAATKKDGSASQGPAGAPSTTSGSTPKATPAKARAPRQPGKQKRRINQAGSKGADLAPPGPSTVGGTIGAVPDHAVPALLGAGGGGRKVLPDHVMPFVLPSSTVRPDYTLLNTATPEEREAFLKKAKLNNGSGAGIAPNLPLASTPGAAADPFAARDSSMTPGRSVSRQIKQPSVEMSDSSDSDTFSSISDSDEDEEERLQRREERKRKREPANVGDSLVLLQSLRQSRLSHLSSLLPPFSQKMRSGTIYPNVLPLSLLHGLNPREPHVLIQLGRADIQVGPHVFVKTKFWEVRPDVELPNLGPPHVESYTGPYGETKRTTVTSCVPKLEAKPERVALPLEAKAPSSSPVKAGKASAASQATNRIGAGASSDQRPSPTSTARTTDAKSTPAAAAATPKAAVTAGPAASNGTSSPFVIAPTPTSMLTKASSVPVPATSPAPASAPAQAPPATAKPLATNAPQQSVKPPLATAAGASTPKQPAVKLAVPAAAPPSPVKPATSTAAPGSATGAAVNSATIAKPVAAPVSTPAMGAIAGAPTASSAIGPRPVQPATVRPAGAPPATSASVPASSSVKPAATAQNTPATAPVGAAATPPKTASQIPTATVTTSASVAGQTTTVSQHVQFAPARLSPISQPSTQQAAQRPSQPATSQAAASAAPSPVATNKASGGSSAPGPAPAPSVAKVAPAPLAGRLVQPPAATTPGGKPPTATTTFAPITGPSRPTPGATAGPRPLQPTTAQARPPASGAQPAIDAVLVSRVNATAALNPELQQLLHVAASGKANPEQLKSLGVWIQAITAQLREDEARAAASSSSSNAVAAGKQADGGAGAAAAKGKGKGKGKDGPPSASESAAGAANAQATDRPKKAKKPKPDPEELSSIKAAKKAAKAEEREAKKKAAAAAKAEARAAAAAQKQQQQLLLQQQQEQQQREEHQAKLRQLPPGWPTDGPPRPPIIVVEFRENPSMRFVLPLWKCVVERREGLDPASMPKVKRERGFFDDFIEDDDDDDSSNPDVKGIEPELKLSFFVPSVGSDAAGLSGTNELEEIEAARRRAEAEMTAQQMGGRAGSIEGLATPERATGGTNGTANAAATATKGGAAASTPAPGAKKLSKKAQKKLDDEIKARARAEAEAAEQEKRHEQFPATWSISGGVTESMWEAFGRVPGAITNAVVRPVKAEPEIELAPDVAEFLVPEIKYHLLDQPEEEIKIHKETADSFVDLYSQLPDRRFVMPCIPPMHIPFGLEDHLSDRFAIRPQLVAARPVAKRKAGVQSGDLDMIFTFGGIGGGAAGAAGPGAMGAMGGIAPGGDDVTAGVKSEEPEPTPSKPPKRKRHVATHNPDGSIKSCGACGKTKTPMWRRGPKGPSQLCNACGARWKAGRLVVPEVAPPPIIEADGDKAKDDKDKDKDRDKTKAKTKGHGSQGDNGAGGAAAGDGNGAPLAAGHGAMSGAVFIPMGSSAASMSMPATTFAPVTGIDMTRAPFVSQALTSPLSSAAYSHSLLSMDGGPMHLDGGGGGFGSGLGMGVGGLSGPSAPGPSPFIRSPNPFPGQEMMPASVDPSVLFGGSSGGI
ncbi:uncharacterized protein PFL1_03434 [Pseudozyma flocculosa PF-1]|uniref:GATA-type domain-containing protein n=2 Tax=Pseudozyma flocculosa TaxID=84751 RepID=A0A5C3FD50_9BASI|nr:uncharacterized protein PFL1_03434 [Pseudozyma flocculosa PF-1]EPQ29147.1 hypothetical protein PFL1_03434 [Pseudozyma flocculosa PF-1]SPO41557.1 uncharacterized protein PSFLO_07039 [Pseudozyma flocculosa]